MIEDIADFETNEPIIGTDADEFNFEFDFSTMDESSFNLRSPTKFMDRTENLNFANQRHFDSQLDDIKNLFGID